VACSADGERFLTGGETVRLWQTNGARPLGAPLPHQSGLDWDGHPVAFHPDGKSIATRDARGIVRVWETERSGTAEGVIVLHPGNSASSTPHPHPAGQTVA